MILPYSRIGPLLLLGRGIGKKVLFQVQPGMEYTVTTENYAKCLMCSPFLAEILGRDLAQIQSYLEGGSKELVESWVYQDVARCLLHLKEGAMKGKVQIDAPVNVLVNLDAVDETFKSEIERKRESILQTLAGDVAAPSALFSKTMGVYAFSRIRKDHSLLDDQLLSLSFIYMEKGGEVCVNSH